MSTAKVVIRGENQISGAMKSAKQDLTGFEAVAKKVGDTLKTAFTVTAIIASLKKLGDACGACFNEFSEANRVYKQLSLTMKDQSAYESAVATIDRLARQTLASKGEVEAMVAELAALGKSSSEIDKISEAAVALSNVTGKDLNSSMTTLLNTYKGTTTQLNKLGIDTSNFSKEELKSGAAVELVISKFGDLSKSMAEADTSQHIQNIKNTFGDIKQEIGGIFDYNFGGLIADVDGMLSTAFGNIQKRIDYVGAIIKNFPEVFKTTLGFVGDMIQTVFSWDFISDFVETTVKNIGTILKGLFDLIPKIVPDTLNFLFNESIATVIKIGAFVLKTFETVIEGIVNAFANTGLGELLNIKKVSINLGSEKLGNKAVEYQNQANGYIQNIAGNIDSVVDIVKTTKDEVKQNTSNLLNEHFGEAITEYKDSVNSIIAPTMEEIVSVADVTNKTVDNTNKNIEKINQTLTSGSFIDKLQGKIATWLDKITNRTETDDDGNPIISAASSTAIGKGLSYFTDSLGEAGDIINELSTNMMTMGPLIGSIVTALKYVFEGFGEIISGPLNDFLQYGLEPIREIGRVIGSLIVPALEVLAPLFQKVSNFLIGLFDSIGAVIQPIIQILASSLTPVLDVIINVLDALTPVLKVVAKAFVTVTGTIQYIIQTLQHWVATLMNWLAGLNLLGWKPFAGLRMSDPGAPGNFGEYIGNKWDEIDRAFSAGTNTATSVSTGTAVTSAGYQGATQVTINIYQQAPVVGDNGMRAFAQMIKDEFDALSYYGVTA